MNDQSARQLISVDGLNETLFVEAGAGTGKTTQLVQRIVNTVLERDVRLSEIAAITFTEAAASELQARIRVEFERRADADDLNHRTRARNAIADADLAAISTVHGFASRLLGEFSVLAGLPPRIAVLDEIASQIANERRWERFVDWLNDEPQFEELLYRAALIEVPLSPRYHGQASFKDVAYNFAQNWDRLDDLAGPEPGAPLGPIDFGDFDDAVAELDDIRRHCTNPDDKFEQHLATAIPQMRSVVGIEDPHRKLRKMQALYRGGRYDKKGRIIWGRGSGGAKGNWDIDIKDAKDHVDAVNKALATILDHVSDEVLDQLMRLTAREVVQAAHARQQDGNLEFHDLLVIARQTLRDRPEVRAALHDRYRHILLDEFQDTDPIQIELASLIAAAPADDQPHDWKDHRVDDGRLFFVGDPKQSIYRFRRADIKLFLEARNVFSAGRDEPVRLATNFRTVPPIIEWVNGLFGAAMADEVVNAQPRYEPLHAGRPDDSGADHRPVVLGGEHPDQKVKAGVLRTAEAVDVAAVIESIVTHPTEWPVRDQRTEQWRPATLNDVTILIPTRTSLPFLRDALTARRIPYRLATGTLVYDTQEIRDALSVLRAIDDPNDTISLVAALRSPLYGCSDPDLFLYHQAERRWSLRNGVPNGLSDDHPVVSALAHMRQLWEQRWWTTPSAMLQRVINDRHGFLLGCGSRRPEEIWRRLRFLLDQARAFEEANGGNLRAFLDWAALQSAEGARVHEPMLPETDDEALQILTIHGSKGLEFPITILSGMTTAAKGKQNGVSVLWDESGPPAVRLRAGVATAEHTVRADIEEEMDAYEKLRLLYVAATRARDHLIVSGHHKTTEKVEASYAGRLSMFAAEEPTLSRAFELPIDVGGTRLEETAVVPAAKIDDDSAMDRQQWIERRAALLEPFAAPTALSATAIARTVDESIVDVDDDEQFGGGDAQSADPADTQRPIVRKKGRAGSAIGSAVHAVMEIVDFERPDTIEPLARRQSELHGVAEHADTVVALARSAFESPAVDLARQHPAFRELYVGAPIGEVMVEGYVDLLVQTPEGLVIVDYKTDSVTTEAAVDAKLAAYELQGATYAVALEASTGIHVVDCRFVFCNTRGAIERSVADLDGAKKRVRDTVNGGQTSISSQPSSVSD